MTDESQRLVVFHVVGAEGQLVDDGMVSDVRSGELEEVSEEALHGRVDIEVYGQVMVDVEQRRDVVDGALERMESGEALFSPSEWLGVHHGVERLADDRVAADERMEEVCEAKECLESVGSVGDWNLHDLLDSVGVVGDGPASDDVAEELDLGARNLTLGALEDELVAAQAREDRGEGGNVLLVRVCRDDAIIEVADEDREDQSNEDDGGHEERVP